MLATRTPSMSDWRVLTSKNELGNAGRPTIKLRQILYQEAGVATCTVADRALMRRSVSG
jgi:hypothetical protein